MAEPRRGRQTPEAANHLAKLTSEEQAFSEWTNICQGVYAEFGNSLALEGLTEAVNHTAKLGEVQFDDTPNLEGDKTISAFCNRKI